MILPQARGSSLGGGDKSFAHNSEGLLMNAESMSMSGMYCWRCLDGVYFFGKEVSENELF
jgi:hypothetical protein